MNQASPEIKALHRSSWDVVVVGAGPSGSLAARELARRGVRVLLVDKSHFPRYKVCGCCLNNRAQKILDSVGLGELLTRQGAIPLEDFEMAAAGRSAVLPLPGGYALSRAKLDAALAEAAQVEGARFVQGHRASLGQRQGAGWTLNLGSAQTVVSIRARLVLAADGLGQRLLASADRFESQAAPSAYIGAGTMVMGNFPYRPGRIYMAVGRAGYVGMVQVEGSQLNIAAALDPKAIRRHGGLGATAQTILEEAGYVSPAEVEAAEWRGTPALTRRASCLSSYRFLVLGDAAGYVEPFTGEGVAWALSTGRAAGELAFGALERFGQETQQAWAKRYSTLMVTPQWRCQAIAATLRRPLLVGLGIRLLGWAPQLAAPVVNRLHSAPRLEKEIQP